MKKSSKKVVLKNAVNSPNKKSRGSGGKVTKIIHESTKEIKIEKALVENFIALQKVMVALSGKFDNLSGQISKLLELFEVSARSLAKKDFDGSASATESKDIKKILEKLDTLSQQAGLIGRGLALIHETNAEKSSYERTMPIIPIKSAQPTSTPMQQTQMPSKPMFQSQQSQSSMQQGPNQNYQRSISKPASETNE